MQTPHKDTDRTEVTEFSLRHCEPHRKQETLFLKSMQHVYSLPVYNMYTYVYNLLIYNMYNYNYNLSIYNMYTCVYNLSISIPKLKTCQIRSLEVSQFSLISSCGLFHLPPAYEDETLDLFQ